MPHEGKGFFEMKNTLRFFALLMALVTLIACFAACGGTDETETETQVETEAPTGETEGDGKIYDEYGREYIEDSIPKDLSFAGAENNTITFFCRDDNAYWKMEMDVDELIDDTVSDAIYYRNVTVEERLGVTITAVFQAGGYSDANLTHEKFLQTLRNSVLNQAHDYDSAAVYASQGAALATEGLYYNVHNLNYLDLEKPWWNGALLEDATLFDALYFLGGDIAISEVSRASLIPFNKRLVEENLGDINLYELVDNGEWTIDKLYELSSTVWSDENSSAVLDDGDIVGYQGRSGNGMGEMDVWVTAMDIPITKMNSDGLPELAFYSPRSIDAFEKLHRLYKENTGALDMNGPQTTKFANGNVMFTLALLESCETYRDMKDQYGALPVPKYDEDQEGYYNVPQNACSLIVVCADVLAEKRDMLGATLELMAAESYRQVSPKYYEVCLKSKYSADVEDARMYDLIISGIRLDFGYIFSTKQIASIGALFRNLDRDFAETYESRRTQYETALEDLVDKLDEISYLQSTVE